MKNVREGIVNDSVRLLTTRKNPNGLMMGEATKETIDQRTLPGKASKVVAEEASLVDPRYKGNVLVSAASAAAGFDVTQTPPVDAVIEPVISTPTKESEIPEIVPVSISIPPVKEDAPVVESVEQVATEPQVSQVINEQPVNTNAIPSIDPVNTTVAGEKVSNSLGLNVETVSYDTLLKDLGVDEVAKAINQELVKPQPPVEEQPVETVLQTPTEFDMAEASRKSKSSYVELIEKIVKLKEAISLNIRKARESANEKYDELEAQAQQELDNLVREAEKLRENGPSFAPVKDALDNQNQVLDQYSQGLGNVR